LNSAFELQKGKGLREGDLFQPYRLVSLWEVLRFYAAWFVEACRLLDTLSRQLRISEQKDRPISRELTEQILTKFHTDLKRLGLDNPMAFTEKLLLYMRAGASNRELEILVEGLLNSIQIELQRCLLLKVSSKRAEYYETKETFLGIEAIDKFAKLKEDADEAGQCFALGRYTACVFHLMRIMEMLAKNLAQKFRVELRYKDLREKTWGKLVGEISDKVKDMKDGTLKQQGKKERFNHSCVLLGDVCRLIRNPLMHPGTIDIEPYNELQAKEVIDRMRSFIDDFIGLPRVTIADFKNPKTLKKKKAKNP